jgi:hypothetical protein
MKTTPRQGARRGWRAAMPTGLPPGGIWFKSAFGGSLGLAAPKDSAMMSSRKRKLGVDSRTEAVHRAHQVGLTRQIGQAMRAK